MPPAAANPAPSADHRFKALDAAMKRHRHQSDSLIEVLYTAQRLFGYLDPACLRYVSRSLAVPPSRVYGVATFYHLLTLEPPGGHTCVVCMGTACYVKGAATILRAAEQACHATAGHAAPDGGVSLATGRCLGACGLAPALVFDDEIAGGMTVARTLARLEPWNRHDR